MNKHSNPLFKVLRVVCPDHLYEEIEGDLIQKYKRDIKTFGKRKATQNLRWNTILFLRPGIVLRNKINLKTRNLMLRDYSKIILRQFARNKTFSIINVLGLTIGITVLLLITQFVLFERSFENFNEKADRTYRVNLYNTNNGVFSSISSGTVPALAHSIKQSISGVESIARIGYRTQCILFSREQEKESRDELFFADPSIVDALGIDIIRGDRKKMLHVPQSILISEAAAIRNFGEINVVGKVLEIGFNNNTLERKPYEVQGVFRDIPANSHFHVELILPPDNEQAWNENWSWSDVKTYVVLSPGVKPEAFDSGLEQIVKQHHEDGEGDRYLLEPVKDIRHSALDGTGRSGLVNFFTTLGIIILVLAWFNYINLYTARFTERMKEVGVRKLIGASRIQLILQFLMESFFFNVISFSCAVVFFFLAWPIVNGFLGQNIPITLFKNPLHILYATGFVIVGTLCSGFYPSIFLSSFKPIQSLKGLVANFADRSMLRKTIVVIQLSVSIILITAVLAIRGQISFMQSQNIGIAIDQTLIIEEPLLTISTSVDKFETFKNDVLQLSDVRGVTYASSFPGAEIDWHRTDITLGQENADFKYDSRIIAIGTEFLDVFKLPLVAGRNLNPEIESDKKAMLISEEASKMFAFNNPQESLGKLVFIGSRRFEVIGVVKNYHYRSLQSKIQPLLYIQGHPRNPRCAIKLSGENIGETISKIEAKWKEAYIGNVFQYHFLDDTFDRQYNSERQIASIVLLLTILAIFISCSGLFALSLYAVNRRTKEIGIRKVLGATVSSVMLLLSRDFARVLFIGVMFSIPLTYYALEAWLEKYAYKMPVDGLLFIAPVAAVAILVAITISIQTITAARRNPVESMKYE